MDTFLSVPPPTFAKRLSFFIERFLRLQEVGIRTTPELDQPLSLVDVSPTEAELERSELVRLSSAAWHLQYGETESRWSHDNYLDRLERAKPELRARALAEHGYTETDYQIWLDTYARPVGQAETVH